MTKMPQFKVFDRVYLYQTGDDKLNHELVEVLGFYANDLAIVRFIDTPPDDYNPAIAISQSCLRS